MKLILAILVTVCLQQGYAAYGQTITISKKNASINSVLKEIRAQTGYDFFFEDSSIDGSKKIDIRIKNGSIEEVLTSCFQDESVSYTISGNAIVIRERLNVLPAEAIAVQRILNGTVMDAEGNALAGVSVSVKGTVEGTTTNSDGIFQIEVNAGDVLVFSYVGFTTQEVIVGNRQSIDVILVEQVSDLDEVMVVGYGTSTKRSLISSVSSVKVEELQDLTITNMTQGLAGRAPGVIAHGSGGGVDKRSTISIRGGGTPLVVIDGIIRSYDDFVNLSPQDIQEFSILKDAAATAVYGSRAAYGILQVTTKRGTEGAPIVSYSLNKSWSQPEIWPAQLESYDRAIYTNLARANDGLDERYSDQALQAILDGSDPRSYGNYDVRSLVLRDFAPQTKHNINMTGGNEAHHYFVSIGNTHQESLYKSGRHDMNRTNLLLTESATVSSIGLKAVASIDAYVQRSEHPYTAASNSYYQVFSHIQNRNPMGPSVNQFGLPLVGANNPVATTAKDAGYMQNNTTQANGNLSLLWTLPWLEDLTLRATGNYRYLASKQKNWRKDAAQYEWDSREPEYATIPLLNHTNNSSYSYTLQYFATYQKQIAAHQFNVLGGYEATYGFSDNYWLQRENFPFPIDQIGVGDVSTQTNSGGESEFGRAGWIGQLKYNYGHKYFFEGSLRYDGSDNFPENRRWGTFYSGAVGWSIADEHFMRSLKERNVFNMLKIRASYGEIGLDNWDSPFSIGRFAYLTSYNYNNKAWVVDGRYAPGFSEGAVASPDITWFTTQQTDIGLDFSSLRDRLYGSFDYFYYRTKGFLYTPNPLEVGYTAPLGRGLARVSTDGEHRRAGIEVQLGWRDQINEFGYDVSFNVTKFDQLWAVKPDESESSLMNPNTRATHQVGYYGNLHRSLGFYTDYNDVYNSVKRIESYDLMAGDLKYQDFNGDGKIDGADQIRLGNSTFPRANYGVNVKLNYKSFFFNFLLQGATNFDMYLGDANRGSSGQIGGGLNVIYEYHTDFWTPDRTDALYPRLMSSPGMNGNNNYIGSDFWLINGAYLRFKDFNLGYDFKGVALKNVNWVSRATLSFTGQNIFTISESTKFGLDPENASTEGYGYPNERVLGLNLNITF